MSNEIDDGGYAFPLPDTYHPNGQIEYGTLGMTLRDWFAGKALAVLLTDRSMTGTAEEFATEAFLIADQMIAVRKKKL